MRTKCVRAAWSFALCLSVALTACDDENNENDGPVVPPPVDESIDLTASEAYANVSHRSANGEAGEESIKK